jgi:hypothetical protein
MAQNNGLATVLPFYAWDVYRAAPRSADRVGFDKPIERQQQASKELSHKKLKK